MRPLSTFVPLALAMVPGWLAAQEAQPLEPMGLRSSRADIVVLEASGAAYVQPDSAMVTFVQACRKVTLVRPADSARVVRAPLQLPADGTPRTDGAVTFVVMPRTGERLDCKSPLAQDRVAPARGVRVTLDTVRTVGSTITRIVLRRGGRDLTGEPSVGTATRLTPFGTLAEARGVARLTVPLESFAPDSAGVPDDLELVVELVDAAPLRVRVPRRTVLEIWDRGMRIRARAVATRPADPSMHLEHLPMPRDSALRVARELYAERLYVAASDSALRRLDAWLLRRADRLTARIQLAMTALAYSDSLAARIHFEHAVEAEPCVALGADAPAAARAMLASIRRPPAACEPAPLHRAALRGALRPGFGHPRGDRPSAVGYAAVGALALVFVGGWSADVAATERYEQYLRFAPVPSQQYWAPEGAAEAYDRAQSMQVRSDALFWLGAALWSAAIVDGIRSELARRERVDALQRFGSAPPATAERAIHIGPYSRPGRLGLAVRFF